MHKFSSLLVVVALAGCGRGGVSESTQTAGQEVTRRCTDCAKQAYEPKDGFVVHEWGTFTSVVGTDGVPLPGLHHEEEDLPGFVADCLAAARVTPGAMQKMETPVTYFYAPGGMKVSAKVQFPGGLFTQWFPWVRDFKPVLYYPWENDVPLDPWLSASVSVPENCAARFSAPPKDGLLDWGEFDLLGRDESVVPAGPVGDGHYRFARNVASNPVQVRGPDGSQQTEKFLFYRGLGNAPMPLTASMGCKGASVFNTHPSTPLKSLLLMNVTHEGAGFVALGDLAGGAQAFSTLPGADQPLPDFVAALKAELRARLEDDGLYRDEAQAMVDTWEKSYFLTPGVRLLYLLPQSDTDRLLPLTISPAPRATLRTMVIRVELLTLDQEADGLRWLSELALPETAAAGRAHFFAQGRFAEPMLRRALALSAEAAQQAAGQALLDEVQNKHRWQPLSAE